MSSGRTFSTLTFWDQPAMLAMTWRWALIGGLKVMPGPKPLTTVPAKSSRSLYWAMLVSPVSGPMCDAPVMGSCMGSVSVSSRNSLARSRPVVVRWAQSFLLVIRLLRRDDRQHARADDDRGQGRLDQREAAGTVPSRLRRATQPAAASTQNIALMGVTFMADRELSALLLIAIRRPPSVIFPRP